MSRLHKVASEEQARQKTSKSCAPLSNLEASSHGARVNSALMAALVRSNKNLARTADVISGEKTSKRWGFGLEFDEIRNYVPGDEVRHINWRASSRNQKLMTKVFIEDKDARILLLVDLMQHMYYGTSKRLCSVMSVYLCAMLASLLLGRSYQVAIGWITDHQLRVLSPTHNQAKVISNLQLLAQNHNAQLAAGRQIEDENEVYKHIHPRLFSPYARSILISTPYGDVPYQQIGRRQELRRLDVYDPQLLGAKTEFRTISNHSQLVAASRLPELQLGEDNCACDLTLVEGLALLGRCFRRL